MLGSRRIFLNMAKLEQNHCEEAIGFGHEDAKIASFSEPETPQNVSSKTQAKMSDISTVRGSLIHLSKSEDGKLRWLPPSSSTTSSSLSEEVVYSGDCCIVSKTTHEAAARSSSPMFISESLKGEQTNDLLCYEEADISEAAEPASSTLTSSFCHHGDVSESFELIHDDSLSLRLQVSAASEISHISVSSHIKESGIKRNERLPTSIRHGLTPYLSSKLKPGKHILGVRKSQVFIRPGQLRHWAVSGTSPAIPSSRGNTCQTSPSSTKGKACRTLNF